MLLSFPAAGAAVPGILLAPSFLLSVNRSRATANASFTNALLPINAYVRKIPHTTPQHLGDRQI